MLCGLILAGGMGKRLWPLSTEERPKQFIKMIEDKSLLQNTVNSMVQFMPMQNVFICTTEEYEDIVRKQFPELPNENVIVEPERRGLATAIMLGVLMIKRYFKNPNILMTPCNYVVEDKDTFKKVINSYNDALKIMKDKVITFGINEWDYRENDVYFTTSNKSMQCNSSSFYRVQDVEVYISRKDFNKLKEEDQSLVGTGIFLAEAKTIIDRLRSCNKESYEILKKLEVCKEDSIKKTLIKYYHKTTSDNEALLDGMKNICVVPIDVGFKRIISWEDIRNTSLVDDNGNISLGNIGELQGKDNVILTNNTRVKIKNIEGLYVMEDKGDIIIGKKEELSAMITDEINKSIYDREHNALIQV